MKISPLPKAQQQLIHGLKSARSKASEQGVANVADAGKEQQRVIEALEGLLDELVQWDNYRRFSREVSRLRRAQGEVTSQTQRLRLELGDLVDQV